MFECSGYPKRPEATEIGWQRGRQWSVAWFPMLIWESWWGVNGVLPCLCCSAAAGGSQRPHLSPIAALNQGHSQTRCHGPSRDPPDIHKLCLWWKQKCLHRISTLLTSEAKHSSVFKGIIHWRMIYIPSCHSKSVWHTFFNGSWKRNFKDCAECTFYKIQLKQTLKAIQ